MSYTLVASNNHAHEKHPKQKKKSAKSPPKKDDDSTAESIHSSGIDHTTFKTVDPPLMFHTTYQPSSTPPHVARQWIRG